MARKVPTGIIATLNYTKILYLVRFSLHFMPKYLKTNHIFSAQLLSAPKSNCKIKVAKRLNNALVLMGTVFRQFSLALYDLKVIKNWPYFFSIPRSYYLVQN